jgi:ribose/xylose/arabinose/galactoside ABC-type transport system permease subunit
MADQETSGGPALAEPVDKPALTTRLRRKGGGSSGGGGQTAARVGMIGAYVVIVIAFAIARPDSFPTLDNLASILDLAAPMILLAVVLTIPMLMGDFDLSFAAVAQLAGAIALYFIAEHHFGVAGAIVIALLVGLVVGFINGMLVAWTGISAFILTLATGSIATGIEFAIAGGRNLGLNLPLPYLGVERTEVLGVTLPVIIVAVVAIVLWWITRQTVFGRAIHAIGGNAEASYLSGIRIKSTRVAAFILVGLGAGFAGIILTSRAASYYPNMAQSLLLPSYAAVFIGAALGSRGQFNVFGTCFGVLFMSTISAGLTMTNQPEWTTNVIWGALLLGAILMTRLEGIRSRFSKASAPAAGNRP